MTQYRIAEAARLFGVSDDTVRRWVNQGRLSAGTDEARRQVIAGADLAQFALELAPEGTSGGSRTSSARNRVTGLITRIVTDRVMAQVDLQCGPHRFVSIMSSEAVEDLGLEVGDLATVVVKATNVIVEKGAGS